jgi:hypothetical protein
MEIAVKVLYHTFSLCPKCTILEKETNLILKKAEVQEKEECIWLSVKCNIHGIQDTLLTKNVEWYHRMWKLAGKIEEASITDIEDLKKKKRLGSNNIPIINEISIYENDAYLSESEIDNQLRKIQSRYNNDDSFILKITGRNSEINNIQKLNEMILYIFQKTPTSVLLTVQVTVERLIALTELPNSCFSKGRIYPNVKYYLTRGQEKECMDEFMQTTIALKSFAGCQLIVSISMESPIPDLSSILAYLRVQRGFIRFIEIIIERSTKHIMESISNVKSTKRGYSGMQGNAYIDSLDPYEVLRQIEDLSEKTLLVNDFFPLRMGSVLEPFLPILGYAKYKIRPSPHCGYGACLINSEKYFSTPITRLLNFEKFFQEIQPLIPDLLSKDIGFFTYAKLGIVVNNCLLPGVEMPNLISFITDKSKIAETLEFVKDMQFIIIHNHMDITMIDMVKRCNCASLVKKNEGLDFYSGCTGCI